MVEKNEYQKEAARLLQDIIRVNVHTFETEPFLGLSNYRKEKIHVCKINGEKYILAGCIFHGFVTRISTMESHGLLSRDKDTYYFYGPEGRVNCFVKVAKIVAVKHELKKLFTDKWNTQNQILPVIDKAVEVDIPDETIPQDKVDNSTIAYRKRNELLQKSKNYEAERRYAEHEEYERNAEAQRIEHEKAEEQTLRSLVSQIEAMGWHVTLTLKDNG